MFHFFICFVDCFYYCRYKVKHFIYNVNVHNVKKLFFFEKYLGVSENKFKFVDNYVDFSFFEIFSEVGLHPAPTSFFIKNLQVWNK